MRYCDTFVKFERKEYAPKFYLVDEVPKGVERLKDLEGLKPNPNIA